MCVLLPITLIYSCIHVCIHSSNKFPRYILYLTIKPFFFRNRVLECLFNHFASVQFNSILILKSKCNR